MLSYLDQASVFEVSLAGKVDSEGCTMSEVNYYYLLLSVI